MDKIQTRNERIFWILIALGIIGFLDFVTRGFITPVFNKTFSLNVGSIGIVSALLFDMFKSVGIPGFLGFVTVLGVFLGDIWWLFLLMAYAIRRARKSREMQPKSVHDK